MSDELHEPPDMRVVTEKEFFAALKADPRNIHPSVQRPYCTTWETPTGFVWGKSTPGWKNGGNPNVPQVYMTDAKAGST